LLAHKASGEKNSGHKCLLAYLGRHYALCKEVCGTPELDAILVLSCGIQDNIMLLSFASFLYDIAVLLLSFQKKLIF